MCRELYFCLIYLGYERRGFGRAGVKVVNVQVCVLWVGPIADI